MGDLPRSRAKQVLEGYSNQASKSLNWVSFVVFVGTGVLWLVSHIQHWPGGYLPWMLTLAAALFAVSSFLNAQRFMQERDETSTELSNYLESTRYALQFTYLNSTNLIIDTAAVNCVLPFQFRIAFKNVSAYPVEYQVISADFTLGNQDSEKTGTGGSILLAGAEIAHRCGLLSGVAVNQLHLVGKGEYTIRYGHPARGMKYQTRHMFHIQPESSNASTLPSEWTWVSIEGPTYEDWSEPEAESR